MERWKYNQTTIIQSKHTPIEAKMFISKDDEKQEDNGITNSGLFSHHHHHHHNHPQSTLVVT